MIMLSDLKVKEEQKPEFHDDINEDHEEHGAAGVSAGWNFGTGSTVLPWWARTNSHGRKKKKRRRRVPANLLLSAFF